RAKSISRDRHFADEHGPGADTATHIHVVADSDDIAIHLLEIARDRNLVHRKGDLAVFHPETTGATRVVARHTVDALPHHLHDQQAGTHACQQTIAVKGLAGCGHDQVV